MIIVVEKEPNQDPSIFEGIWNEVIFLDDPLDILRKEVNQIFHMSAELKCAVTIVINKRMISIANNEERSPTRCRELAYLSSQYFAQKGNMLLCCKDRFHGRDIADLDMDLNK